jgi:hypothetical protein
LIDFLDLSVFKEKRGLLGVKGLLLSVFLWLF